MKVIELASSWILTFRSNPSRIVSDFYREAKKRIRMMQERTALLFVSRSSLSRVRKLCPNSFSVSWTSSNSSVLESAAPENFAFAIRNICAREEFFLKHNLLKTA
ncbi:hypothetical protein LEP1GSC052_1703 [Leptospira kmetyi serovar Malaysia str. Bejo-Iso9]|nr:hypothetical protein LEP1GSC052_1703 [Leptospira kmetyi serovar Malaysia str. Bejo-Iso9]